MGMRLQSALPDARSAAGQDAACDGHHCRLLEFLSRINTAVAAAMPGPLWVHAEIFNMSVHPSSGHTYFELVETDADNRVVAKLTAMISSRDRKRLLNKFEQGVGSRLSTGMKVLVMIRPQVKPSYGLAAVITDIDPSYTIGHNEQKVREIVQALVDEGIVSRNLDRTRPFDFWRVAVIRPAQAGGLDDFQEDADRLSAAGLCEFRYFPAVFHGNHAASSIVSALRSVWETHRQSHFDAAIILRGGAAAPDLMHLNDMALARAVCMMPMPVFVSLGPQRGRTALDLVAQSFDTPSKVSMHLVGTMVANANAAVQGLLEVQGNAGKLIASAEDKLQRNDAMIAARSAELVSRKLSEVESALACTRAYAEGMLERSENKLRQMLAEIIGLGPRATIDRGYVMVRDGQGNSVTSAFVAAQRDDLELEFHDGRIGVAVLRGQYGRD